MLAPGELLTSQVTELPPTGSQPERPPGAPATPGPAAGTDDESESFLMILLRALGAIHT